MEITLNLSARQTQAFNYLNDQISTEVLYGGAAGGGKSYLGAAWLIINCLNYKGSRWLMGRAKLKALKQTTLKTFFEITAAWGLDEHYSYNAQSGEITFFNKSQIILKDLFAYPSDPNFDSLGSLEITGAFIDEVNQITEKAKNIVASRIRYKLDEFELIPKLFMSCNPAKNWVFDEFYKKAKEGILEEYKQFVPALVTDNPNISQHYIAQLKKLDEISKRRLLFGEWEYEDGGELMIYSAISSLFKRNTDDLRALNKEYYISVDVARFGADKSVIYVWAGLSVIKIVTFAKNTINELVGAITTLAKEYRVSHKNIVIDADGVGGGVVDYVKGCYSFVNNSKALGGDNYQNLKTQCYYLLATAVNSGKLSIYDWDIDFRDQLTAELNLVKAYNTDKDGKLQITPKADIKAQLGGKSPDYADALAMRMIFEAKAPAPATPFFIG